MQDVIRAEIIMTTAGRFLVHYVFLDSMHPVVLVSVKAWEVQLDRVLFCTTAALSLPGDGVE